MEVSCYLSDKASPLIPPYAGAEQTANLAFLQQMLSDAEQPYIEQEAEEYLHALACPEQARFTAEYLAQREAQRQMILQQLAEKRFWTGGASVTYLVSAQR